MKSKLPNTPSMEFYQEKLLKMKQNYMSSYTLETLQTIKVNVLDDALGTLHIV